MDAFWIILTGSLVAICCSMLGSFLILRKMAMLGDAISHAVLPGLVIAYLASGSRASLPMLAGAALFGVFTTFIIELLHGKFKLQSDASIGISFTALFAVGVIMVSAFAGQIDLDQECVLYGEIAYIPLDVWFVFGKNIGPYAVYVLLFLFILLLVFFWYGYQALKITSFDKEYAVSIGISTAFWQYSLMSMVSFTTVVSFEQVGAILVVAFFIIPAATAYLLTHHLRTMIILSCLFGVASAGLGYLLAVYIDGSIAGAMATVSGLIFFIVFVAQVFFRRVRVESFFNS